jgi:hypothetical protein
MRDGDPDIKPIEGVATGEAIPQAGMEMVVPAGRELPNEEMNDARQGGRIFTEAYSSEETRPQEFHSSVKYQEATADPMQKPNFVAYTDLTAPREEIIG